MWPWSGLGEHRAPCFFRHCLSFAGNYNGICGTVSFHAKSMNKCKLKAETVLQLLLKLLSVLFHSWFLQPFSLKAQTSIRKAYLACWHLVMVSSVYGSYAVYCNCELCFGFAWKDLMPKRSVNYVLAKYRTIACGLSNATQARSDGFCCSFRHASGSC